MAASETMIPRDDHLAWCKQRALEYCQRGDVANAWGSMVSDLQKHPGTQGHIGIELGMLQLMAGHLGTPAAMRDFIEGFN